MNKVLHNSRPNYIREQWIYLCRKIPVADSSKQLLVTLLHKIIITISVLGL
jgi:hypothetical protein